MRSGRQAWMRSGRSPTAKRSRRRWRSITSAARNPARCPGSAGRSRRDEAGALSMDAATRGEPGDPSVQGRRHHAHAFRGGAADAVGGRHAHVGELAFVPANRPCRHRRTPGCVVVVHRPSRRDQEAAGYSARRPRHGEGLGPAVAEPGQPAGPRLDTRRAESSLRRCRASATTLAPGARRCAGENPGCFGA